jgi:hypothetical protein
MKIFAFLALLSLLIFVLKEAIVLKRPNVSNLLCLLWQLTLFSQKRLVIGMNAACCTTNCWKTTDAQPSAWLLKPIKPWFNHLNVFSVMILQKWSRKRLDQYFSGTELAAQ